MITRKERAKQFMPFDAMKGLQEALRKQEEINSRVEKHEVCEEQQAKLSELLSKLDKGMRIWLFYYPPKSLRLPPVPPFCPYICRRPL